jgi:hypothetical protein
VRNQAQGGPGTRPGAGPASRRLPWLAVVLLLLAACQGPRAEPRIDLPAEPWALVAEAGGLWVVLSDRTVARYDPVTARIDGDPVRLPFTPGAMVGGTATCGSVGRSTGGGGSPPRAATP